MEDVAHDPVFGSYGRLLWLDDANEFWENK